MTRALAELWPWGTASKYGADLYRATRTHLGVALFDHLQVDPECGLPEYNDDPARSQPEILGVVDLALESAAHATA